jgi:hypothetical protein
MNEEIRMMINLDINTHMKEVIRIGNIEEINMIIKYADGIEWDINNCIIREMIDKMTKINRMRQSMSYS